ncbi:MAG TPA: Crp/Fnr family transcriptional regulator [Drouetiella sp.]
MTKNLLLNQLNPTVREKVLQRTEEVHFSFRDSLVEPNKEVETVYFPETCVASIVTPIDQNKLIEAATIGRDGFIGLPAFLRTKFWPETVFCQIEGTARMLKTAVFEELLDAHPEFRSLCSQHTAIVLHQMARNLACNSAHTIQQRCARWLLLSNDRVGGSQFYLTQETLAIMLGVSRTGVNIAAGGLQDAGLITYVRGKITILNRTGLESISCNCYRSITDYRRQFFPDNLIVATEVSKN